MALHVLNFSVDPPDTHVYKTRSGEVKEDLSVDEAESLVEWVLEHVLNLTNAVPEHDDADPDEHLVKAFFYWIAPASPLSFIRSAFDGVLYSARFTFCSASIPSRYTEIVSPPPWQEPVF